MKSLAALSWGAAFWLATVGWASEVSFVPIPAYSPEAQAVREGAAFRAQGDRLQEEAPAEKVREAWQAAVDAYHRAGYQIGEVELLSQIATSYQAEIMSGPEAMPRVSEAMIHAVTVSAEFVDGMARLPGAAIPTPDAPTEDLLKQGYELAETGDCARALSIFAEARARSAEKGAATGELRALAGRFRCQSLEAENPFSLVSFMLIYQDFFRIVQDLDGKLKAGPAARHLRAVESAEIGKLEEAETLLRAVLPELQTAGDAAGAGRAALDLGYVLLRKGTQEEAEPFLRQAREIFASRQDPDSRRNYEAAEENLAGLGSPLAPVPGKLLESETGPAAEILAQPWPPEPAGLSSRARARREGAFLLGQGDRLDAIGRRRLAREKWQAAAETYRRGEDLWELAPVYFRLAGSYGSWSLADPKERWLCFDFFDLGLAAYAEAYRKELPVSPEDLDQADYLRQRAADLVATGGCAEALPLLADARKLYHRAGFALGESRTLISRARCLFETGDFLGGQAALIEWVPIVSAMPVGAPADELQSQANDLFEKGRWIEARAAYRDLLCSLEREGDLLRIGQVLLALGKVEKALGNLAEAEILIERSLSLLPLADEELDETREGSALDALGDVYFSTGRLEEGIAALGQARQVFEKAGRPEKEAVALRSLALGLLENDEYAAALSALDEAAALRKLLPRDSEEEGELAFAKAWIQYQQGKSQEALAGLYEVRDLYRQAGSTRKQVGALLIQIGLLKLLGRQEETLELYEKVGDLTGRSATAILPQLGKIEEMLFLVKRDQLQEAIDRGRALLAGLEGDEGGSTEIMARSLLSLIYLSLGRMKEARAELDVIDRSVSAGRGQEPLRGMEGSMVAFVRSFSQWMETVYAFQEQSQKRSHPEAKEILASFAKSFGERLEKEPEPRPGDPFSSLINQFPRVLQTIALQDAPGTLREMDQMFGLFDRWTEGVRVSELKEPLAGDLAGFYSMAVEQSESARLFEEGLGYAEKARAQVFASQIGNQRIDARKGADPKLLREERKMRFQLNRLRKALLDEKHKPFPEQDRERLESLKRSLETTEQEWEGLIFRLKVTNPESELLLPVEPVSVEEIRTHVLDGETTLVEYFVSEDDSGGVFAWVIERERFEMIRLSVSSGDLSARVEELRKRIEAKDGFRPQAAALYGDLFAPLAPRVTHKHLIVVPHGVLHFLPFSALWDEKGGRSLGEGWTLSFAPSATVLKFIRERTVKTQRPVLAIGNPDGTLSHAAEEARTVARLYGAEPLVGGEATEGTLLSRAPEAGILHLATHAELNPINPLFTSIKLAPDAEHDGNLEMHEVYGLDLSKTGLVVLSACNTQMGRLSRGDEIEGLTRAFLYAGTPAVVSSL